MTEHDLNPSPRYLVRVTHPDGEQDAQLRLDAADDDAALDEARRWLAGARSDDAWLKGDAEIIPDAEQPADPPDVDTSVTEQPRTDTPPAEQPAGGTDPAGPDDVTGA